jgi:hypothetical protein
MTIRRFSAALAALIPLGLGLLALPGPAIAATACSQPQYRIVHQASTGQVEFLNRDAFNGGFNCVTNHGGTDNFVTSRVQYTAHGVRSYPNLMVGCNLPANGFFGACTGHARLPRQIRNMAAYRVTWHTSHSGVTGHWNTGLDIWTSQQQQFASLGSEIMVWLNERNQPAPSTAIRVTIAGRHYLRWTRPAAHWTEIIYLRQPETSSVDYLHLGAILADAATIPNAGVDPSSYVQQIAGGFEMWTGGSGLSVSEFREFSG